MYESVFSLLERIEKRPGMYVGGSDQERDEQLRNLQWVLTGIEIAIAECRPAEGHFQRDFGDFLMEHYDCSANRGPICAIQDLAPNPDEAWDLFWRCVRQFRGQEPTPPSNKVACPCCGYATLSARDIFDICAVCYWEDDGQDSADADITKGGPNGTSLTAARRNYLTYGACDERSISAVRPPRSNEAHLRSFRLQGENVIEE